MSIVKDIDPILKSKCDSYIPKFYISFGSFLSYHLTFVYNDNIYYPGDFRYPIESMHINGEKDFYVKLGHVIEHQLFTKNPIMIWHKEGHNIPKHIDNE
jgi:hypothetical protein